MWEFVILILGLNFDAFSYGATFGMKKIKLKFLYILAISTLSTILFSTTLYFSSFINNLFNPKLLSIINGIFLIFLGIKFIFSKKEKNTEKRISISFKQCLLDCFFFSVDAITTALLCAFSENYLIFCAIFYYFSLFFALFVGNRIFYCLNHKLNFNLDIFCGIIFIFLGFFKIFSI